MKKKLILPRCFTYFIFLGVMFGFLGVAIWFICYIFMEHNFSPLYIVGLISAIVIAMGSFIYAVNMMIRTRIELRADQVFVPKGTGLKGRNLIQHEKRIPYTEIAGINFAYAITDSEGESVKSLMRPIFYLLLVDDKNECKAISMDPYTKNQAARIIDEIVARCKNFGRDIPIESGKKFLVECIEDINRKEKSGRKKK